MSRKINCWEFKKCGREPGGKNIDELGVCLTPVYTQYDGINGGRNGGRVCWAVSGTMCDGNYQASVAAKQSYCMDCSFYRLLMDEVETEELTNC